jgi:hypothetical protein
MTAPYSNSTPKVNLPEALHIDIKTRSVCDPRKVDVWTYSENWSTDIWVVGHALGHRARSNCGTRGILCPRS